MDIFSRLLVKPLLRLKCVCKTFNTVISDPTFVKLHSRIPKTTFSIKSHLLDFPSVSIVPYSSQKVARRHNPEEIFIGSCNGLICLGDPLYTESIILWNPAINMCKDLPPSDTGFGTAVKLPHSTIKFGPPAPASLGFGCNADGSDFKVVRITSLKGQKNNVKVFSSKLDSWQTIEGGFDLQVVHPKSQVVVAGNPYWVARDFDNALSDDFLLGFDATGMFFKPVVRVSEEMGLVENLAFVDWEGSLGALACSKRDRDIVETIELWLFDEKKFEWVMNARFGPIHLRVPVDRCLGCSRDGQIMGGLKEGWLFVYDPKMNSIIASGVKKRHHGCFHICAYNESLAYLRGMVPMETTIVSHGPRHTEVRTVVPMERVKLDHEENFKEIAGFLVSCMHSRDFEIRSFYALGASE